MKKLLYMMGMVLLLASCTDDYDDWADPQSNPAEGTKTVTLTVANASAIDYATAGDTVQLFVPTIAAEDDQTTYYQATLLNSDANATASVQLTTDDQGRVLASDLKDAVVSLYGKKPVAREIPINIVGYTNINGQSIRTTGSATATVTLVAPYIDPDGYYLVGDMLAWSVEGAKKFDHNGTGDVYDEPEFTINFEATAANQCWKIIPAHQLNADHMWDGGDQGVVGVTTDGDVALEGNLTTNNPGAGKIETPGRYHMVINMQDYTYTITKLPDDPDLWYLIGSDIGDGSWNNSTDGLGKALIPLYPTPGEVTKLHYVGYFKGDGFKLIHTVGGWDEQWGQGSDGSLVKNDGGSGNITVAAPGYYEVTYDQAADKLTVTPYTGTVRNFTTITMPGEYQGWNVAGNAMTAVTTVAENHDWFSTVTFASDASADGGVKFANGTWDINWGNPAFPWGIGTQGGDNMLYKAGTYKVYFNDITGAYYYIAQ